MKITRAFDCKCYLVIMLSWFYRICCTSARRFLVLIAWGKGAFCVHVLPVFTWVFLGSLTSSWFKETHLGASWWLRIDLWQERAYEWLSVSILLRWDKLTTCLGQSAPLAPRQMGEAPAPRKAPLGDKAIDDGRMQVALPGLIPSSGTTWNSLSEVSIISSLLTSVSKLIQTRTLMIIHSLFFLKLD